MRRFAQLYQHLDRTTSTNEKIRALTTYLETATASDKLWAIALLSARRPRRTVNTALLRIWAADRAEIAPWLFDECYDMVGDLAETITLVLPPPVKAPTSYTLTHWIAIILDLKNKDEVHRKSTVFEAWDNLSAEERFIFNKLITGGFRVGVSNRLVIKALSQVTGVPDTEVTHRLSGKWDPQTDSYDQLFGSSLHEDISKPYPFFLAYALESVDELGSPEAWAAELKWDGIRGQLIKRQGQLFLWSRGDELVTDKFPELHPPTLAWPDGLALDGEILPYKDHPLPFAVLQTRLGRKTVSKNLLAAAPVVFMAYDLLEYGGEDWRERPYAQRRRQLMSLLQENPSPRILLSEQVTFNSWEELSQIRVNARQYHSEGLMLKKLASTYLTGRKRGSWWKWKIDPLTIDAVLIYAQRGHGRRASWYTDFTFAVWQNQQLIPFTKSYSGLTDEEFKEVNRFIRQHTLEKFGPVAVIKPDLVFEIAFEGIQSSSRHKSGIALRFPRILRWRKDKPATTANTLDDLKELLRKYGA